MNTYALPALREKRARIAGEIDALQRQIVRHVEELNSLDQTIALFDPTYRVGSIRPIATRKRAQLFKMGQLGRLILSALRQARRPMRTAEIIVAVCKSVGQPDSGKILRSTIGANLNYLARRGRVIKSGGPRSAQWELPREFL